MAVDADERSSPRGADTGKGKRGATSAAFQGLRRRLERCITTEGSFAAYVEAGGRDFGLAKEGPTQEREVGLGSGRGGV